VRDRLNQLVPSEEPIAIAYSGGGDSTALLHMLAERDPLVLIVDHNLSEGSAERTELAVKRAMAMRLRVVERRWDDPPEGAMQRHARVARYTLLGETCRAAGVRTLITGHTLDDQVETHAMSGGAALMRPVSHAPVWPGMRVVDVVRPMLDVRRGALREYNRKQGLEWIEDPANADVAYRRVAVRQSEVVTRKAIRDCNKQLDQKLKNDSADARNVLNELETVDFYPGYARTAEALGLSLLRLLLARRGGPLGGALFEKTNDGWLVTRDPGAVLGRSGVPVLGAETLRAGVETLWDGRVLVTAFEPGLRVKPIGDDVQAKMSGLPLAVRRALPGVYRGAELVALPGWGDAAGVEDVAEARVRSVLEARLRSAK
jgi:tRNA(Ile)-lysidine synthase